jgi:cell division initiation protein
MKMTPLEIRKVDFSRSLRGYDPEEVRAFLETVADQMDLLQRDVNDFSEKIVRLETHLADFQMMEKSLQETLMRAEETLRRSREVSQQEAENTRKEAEIEAQRIQVEARANMERLKAETQMLQSNKEAFLKKLKYLLQSQTDLIEILEGKEFSDWEENTGSSHGNDPTTVG